MQIRLGGQPVGGFTYNKARALLVYLAVEADRPHQRDALATLLWPDMPDEAARHNLRQALANLRTAIGDTSATPPFMLITRDTIQFNPGSDDHLDVSTFTALLVACESHAHRHLERCRSCAARMEQAITLYRGDFLAGFAPGDSAPFEEWQLRQRERLHQQVLDILARLADYHERRGDDERARHVARRQIELEPWREEAHRQLMRLLARGHQRSAALAQYETCRRILACDLGIEPETQTTALYERIRDGALRIESQEPRTEQTDYSRFPVPPTPLIGREAELAELGALLESPACRLITLVGPGGIGKTRVALAAATEQAETFADGAAFVPLQAISSAAFLVPAILSALDIPLQGQREPRAQLLDYLRSTELLLVLDNFEQLLAPDLSENEGGAALLRDILQHAPGTTLLVTSRERLALHGEWLFEVAGLSYPIGEPADNVKGYSAVQLFVQRAVQVRRQFALDSEAPAVARICQLVEGLPLAIELAAAALRTRSCTAIAAAIESSLSALAIELRAVPERHRSIRATFEHSWRLLSEEERQVFPRLSAFRGGFEEDAAAQVAQASSQLLAALVDKSLLRWDGTARYDMHELIRQYASEKLEQVGEAVDIRQRHAAYFLALAETAEPELWAHTQVVSWLDRLAADHHNFRAALSWSSASMGDCELGLRMAGALEDYWLYRNIREGRSWLEGLLAQDAAEVASPPQRVVNQVRLRARAKALRATGMLAETGGALVLARAFLEESTALFQNLEEPRAVARSQWFLAHLAWTQGAYVRAAQLAEESLRGYRAADDMPGVGWCLWLLSNIAREQGDLARAWTLADTARTHAQELRVPVLLAYALLNSSRVRLALGDTALARSAVEESLALARQLGHTTLIAHALLQLGRVADAEGDQARAVTLWEQALDTARNIQHLRAVAELLLELGGAEHQQGNDARAKGLLIESLCLYRDRGHQPFIAECLAGLASVVGAKASTPADVCHTARLYGAADAMHAVGNAMLRPGDRIADRHNVTTIRARLGEVIFTTAWDEGRAMTVEQTVAYALEVCAADTAEPVSVASSTQ